MDINPIKPRKPQFENITGILNFKDFGHNFLIFYMNNGNTLLHLIRKSSTIKNLVKSNILFVKRYIR